MQKNQQKTRFVPKFMALELHNFGEKIFSIKIIGETNEPVNNAEHSNS